MTDAVPCRLSVYLARDAPSAVILRRGPSDWAQLVAWNRADDSFTPGQWFHGRVHERRCDLSPDGRYFVYFACKHGPRADPEGVGECWTALSRPPWFTALALWPSVGAWYGGGCFRPDGELLCDGSAGIEPHPAHRPDPRLRVTQMDAGTAPWEQRMLRDGWRLVERGFEPRNHRRVGRRELWEKPQPAGDLRLGCEIEDAELGGTRGLYPQTYWLERGAELLPLDGVTWADWDGGRRLVFARRGSLWSAHLRGDALDETRLRDFDPDRPESRSAPDQARRW